MILNEIKGLAQVKGNETYIFIYSSDHRDEMLSTLGRYASDERLSFTLNDAVHLSQEIRFPNQKNNRNLETDLFEIPRRF